jgi:signal transduction histidine kinase
MLPIGNHDDPPRQKAGWALRLPWFGPALVTLTMLALMALLFWRLQTDHLDQQRQALDRSLATARDAIAARLDADESFLRVLADQAAAGALISSEFHRLSSSYISDRPNIKAVYFTRPDHTVLWASPALADEQGDDALIRLPEHANAFEKAIESASPIYTKPHIGLAGTQSFDLYVPVLNRKKPLGLLVISYSNRKLIQSILDPSILEQYQTELLGVHNRWIYSMPSATGIDSRLIGTIALDPPGNGMSLRLTKYVSTFWDTGTVALAAICFALISGMGLGLWALNRQIIERVRIELALHDANTDLEERVKERTHALSATNEKLASEMAERQVAEERARRHMDHLAQIGRVSTMGEMAAGLAHELHQPLAAITSYAKGCLRILNDPTPDSDRVRYAVTHIDKQSTRAAEIIDRLRTFLTPDSPEKFPQDLLAIIQESAGFVDPERKRLGIDLTIDVDDQTPPVMVDRVQIQQVLVNLIKNAFESLQASDPNNRSVSIKATPADSNEVLVHVHDSGQGCKPQDLSRVFEPFVSTKTGSMGMGLSISRTIIEAHEGRLWATAENKNGMTFSFTLTAVNHEKT